MFNSDDQTGTEQDHVDDETVIGNGEDEAEAEEEADGESEGDQEDPEAAA